MAYKQLTPEKWNEKVLDLANAYLSIRECQKCGSPYNQGYCCASCGDSNPRMTKEAEQAWNKKYNIKPVTA